MTELPRKSRTSGPIAVGRYVLHDEIASGGMATVYMGRLAGPAGFTRVVAIKRMHDLYASDPELVTMFLDEASLAARIQHPNVAATLDVVAKNKEIFIVMDYVHGESLATLLRTARKRKEAVPVGIVCSILCGVLAGLHAAHIARGEGGEELHIVHRDVSPQNVLIGPEGLARVVDFGVAKATSRLQSSGNADGRGKLGYTAPERLRTQGAVCDARADIFSVAVMGWEMLAGRRLFTGVDEGSLLADVLNGPVPDLTTLRQDVTPALWGVLQKGLARTLEERHASAEEFAREIEHAMAPASARAVGAWVMALAKDAIATRERSMRAMESGSSGKRPGSQGDAMSVGALVEEIEAKSTGDRRKTSAPPSVPASGLSGFSSQAPTRIERVPSTPREPEPSASDTPSASHDPIVIPGLDPPRGSRRWTWGILAGAGLLGGALLLVGGEDEVSRGPLDAAGPGASRLASSTLASVPETSSTKLDAKSDPPVEATASVSAPAASAPAVSAPSASAPAVSAPSASAKATSAKPPAARPSARPGSPPGKKPGYIPDRP